MERRWSIRRGDGFPGRSSAGNHALCCTCTCCCFVLIGAAVGSLVGFGVGIGMGVRQASAMSRRGISRAAGSTVGAIGALLGGGVFALIAGASLESGSAGLAILIVAIAALTTLGATSDGGARIAGWIGMILIGMFVGTLVGCLTLGGLGLAIDIVFKTWKR